VMKVLIAQRMGLSKK